MEAQSYLLVGGWGTLRGGEWVVLGITFFGRGVHPSLGILNKRERDEQQRVLTERDRSDGRSFFLCGEGRRMVEKRRAAAARVVMMVGGTSSESEGGFMYVTVTRGDEY